MSSFLLGLGVPAKGSEAESKSSFWRIMFGFPIVVGLVMALLFSLVFRSDTPKFLLKSGRRDEGKKVLAKITEMTTLRRR